MSFQTRMAYFLLWSQKGYILKYANAAFFHTTKVNGDWDSRTPKRTKILRRLKPYNSFV